MVCHYELRMQWHDNDRICILVSPRCFRTMSKVAQKHQQIRKDQKKLPITDRQARRKYPPPVNGSVSNCCYSSVLDRALKVSMVEAAVQVLVE